MTSLAVRRNVSLAGYTTFRIGGPADYFIAVRTLPQIRQAVEMARDMNLPFFLLGGGSNILVCDRGFRGIVIRNALRGISQSKNILRARTGETLARVLDSAAERGLAGLDFAAGIPGTFGGAIYGNAGAYGQAIGDFLLRAKILKSETGDVITVDREYFGFGYRYSGLKECRDIVLEAELELTGGNPAVIRKRMDEIIEERRQKHPSEEWGCAGSYFKNLDPEKEGMRRVPAGLVLEKVGAKGMTMGKAVVYPGHANFITNPGGASCADVLALAGELKNKVKREYGIDLEEEVRYVDECIRDIV